MLVIDHFYLCEKQFPEGPLILGSGLTVWFTELLTLSLGGDVKIQTSPFKVRFRCPERRRDLTVVAVPRAPSCMRSASFTVYLCPSHLLLALGSGHLHLQVCATPDSLCLRALEETWEGAVVGVIPSKNCATLNKWQTGSWQKSTPGSLPLGGKILGASYPASDRLQQDCNHFPYGDPLINTPLLAFLPPLSLSLPSPSPASWDHLPNQLPAPKSLSQGLLFTELKDCICMPGSVPGRRGYRKWIIYDSLLLTSHKPVTQVFWLSVQCSLCCAYLCILSQWHSLKKKSNQSSQQSVWLNEVLL